MLGSTMVDHATPNLPSRDFDATITFYSALRFAVVYRDSDWLILSRGTLILESKDWHAMDLHHKAKGHPKSLRLATFQRRRKSGLLRQSFGGSDWASANARITPSRFDSTISSCLATRA